MKLAIGSDHAGFGIKERLIQWLRSPAGGRHQVRDAGCQGPESCDYPDYAVSVGRAVSTGRATRGILVCGTGIGMGMAANKIRGVRAAVTWNPETAALASEHNKANILCIPARYADARDAQRMVKAFLATRFGGGRHARRVKKILALDR